MSGLSLAGFTALFALALSNPETRDAFTALINDLVRRSISEENRAKAGSPAHWIYRNRGTHLPRIHRDGSSIEQHRFRAAGSHLHLVASASEYEVSGGRAVRERSN